ncbi:MAG TPA: hypothetical protein VE175_16115, partial [Woeseiaceae bacterium]|nr:hypothetical protein [Woeseiaceae bacterium]
MDLRILAVSMMDRAPWWRPALVVCALGPAAGLLCPPAYARADAIIWEGNDQAVILAPQDEKTAPPNEHPATVDAADIERMLESLRLRYVEQEADAPPVSVFNAEQVAILGKALATGLSRATPSQDVTFSVIGARRLSPDAFVRRNRLTAGRVFFREGKLNVIFGELQSPYRKKNIYGRIDQDFRPREYGSRTRPVEQEAVLVAGTAYDWRREANGPRHDWVVFHPSRDPGPAASTSPDGAPRPEESRESRAAPVETADPVEPLESGDIEQRLRTLKRLREKGLISERAYREKVNDILEE